MNMHLYRYAGNNPVRFTDPNGRSDIDEIQQQIQNTQQQYREASSGKERAGLFGEIMGLFGQYNNAVIEQGGLGIQDYIQNGTVTGGFGEDQGLTGNYQTTGHNGVDGVGGYAKTPFYTQVVGESGVGNTPARGSNPVTLEIIGTNLKMQILHGDAGSLRPVGGTFTPGQQIMPFPKGNNDPASSTGPHFHFQMSNGSQFVNPFTMKASDTTFQFTRNGGRTWSNFRADF